ncbi:cell division ATP-binding protein FtsE [Alphaproteobacteria bacterium]|nr:cell division ATP-binding protein FtsE [Alphaproteobacteria bacterium]
MEGVGLRYGAGPEVLKDVSLRLETGSFHFLTGASGAGKSSLMGLMYLALKPTRGHLTVLGTNVIASDRSQLAKIRAQIGVVFQDFRLIPGLSAAANAALPLTIAGVSASRVRRQTTELMEWVGLKEHLDAPVETLSGGQQQRVAIARAVIARPKLLFADEPTGNVDDRIAQRIMTLFTELNRMGTTVVVATHNDALVAKFSFPRLHLGAGRLETYATMPGLFDRPEAAAS